MKKIIAFLMTIISAMFFAACTALEVSPNFLENPPWGVGDVYEMSTYDVKIYERVPDGKTFKNGDVLASGTYTFTINQAPESPTLTRGVLTTLYTVTYEDIEKNGADRGKTDTVESSISFYSGGFTPQQVTKRALIAPRKASASANETAYQENYSFEYTADYTSASMKATLKKNIDIDANTGDYTRNDDGTVKYKVVEDNFPLKSGIFFDNEQVYLLTRYLKDLRPEGSASAKISNIYEIQKSKSSKNKYKFINLSMSAAKEFSQFTLGSYMDGYTWDKGENDENGYDVSCMNVTLTMGSGNTGPNTVVSVTKPGLGFTKNGAETSRIITKIEYKRFDVPTLTEKKLYSYTLTDYKSGSGNPA